LQLSRRRLDDCVAALGGRLRAVGSSWRAIASAWLDVDPTRSVDRDSSRSWVSKIRISVDRESTLSSVTITCAAVGDPPIDVSNSSSMSSNAC